MKFYHFIDGQRDKFGSYHVLWHTGNYMYEIECRSTGNKISLENTSFEEAKEAFRDVLVSY